MARIRFLIKDGYGATRDNLFHFAFNASDHMPASASQQPLMPGNVPAPSRISLHGCYGRMASFHPLVIGR